VKLFRRSRSTTSAQKVLEELLSAPHHGQYQLFVDESGQPCPRKTVAKDSANSEAEKSARLFLLVILIVIWAAMQTQKETPAGRRISLPPGALLNYLADFFCSPKTLDRVVSPIISDMQTEYCKALAKGRKAKASWIRLRGYWSFWKALGFYAVVKNLAAIWKISRLG
jgi:hypothetical protein